VVDSLLFFVFICLPVLQIILKPACLGLLFSKIKMVLSYFHYESGPYLLQKLKSVQSRNECLPLPINLPSVALNMLSGQNKTIIFLAGEPLSGCQMKIWLALSLIISSESLVSKLSLSII
jgi:hypothetical protein